jgi:hypothetical protein
MASRPGRKEEKRQRENQRRLEKLKSKLKRGSTASGHVMTRHVPGQERMSEVLEDFIEPYMDLIDADSLDEFRKLVSMGALAWNLSLLPAERRGEEIDAFHAKWLPKSDKTTATDFRSLIEKMIARKLARFPNNRRFIMKFEVADQGDNFYLQVASTPENIPEGDLKTPSQ